MRLKKHKSKLLPICFGFLILLANGMIKTTEAQVEIGIFADCQFCDCETAGNRYYRNSLEKLEHCISDFNAINKIDFVVGLGDLIDRDFDSFKKVNVVLAESNHNVYQVSGNHDFSVQRNYFEEVTGQLNQTYPYYSIDHKNWRFIFLNGNDITLSSNNKRTIKQAEHLLSELNKNNQPNNKEWNGGIGQKQIDWLKTQLKEAEKDRLNVVLFCHYPLLPLGAHSLWNSTKILSILHHYNCVKAWINGHNHAGGYTKQNGIHFITLKGMVETETTNAYSVISFSEKEINITGFGREQSRILEIK